MAKLTQEQIEQKKQLLAEKMNEMKAIHDELVEAGALSLSDEDLEKVAGGIDFSKLDDVDRMKIISEYARQLHAVDSRKKSQY